MSAKILTLPEMMRVKLKELTPSDYIDSKFTQEELTILGSIADDKEAELDDRIIAARSMVNIAENRLLRAQRQVEHWKKIWLGIEHTKQMQRNEKNFTDQALKALSNVDGVEDVLEALLNQLKLKKEMK